MITLRTEFSIAIKYIWSRLILSPEVKVMVISAAKISQIVTDIAIVANANKQIVL